MRVNYYICIQSWKLFCTVIDNKFLIKKFFNDHSFCFLKLMAFNQWLKTLQAVINFFVIKKQNKIIKNPVWHMEVTLHSFREKKKPNIGFLFVLSSFLNDMKIITTCIFSDLVLLKFIGMSGYVIERLKWIITPVWFFFIV